MQTADGTRTESETHAAIQTSRFTFFLLRKIKSRIGDIGIPDRMTQVGAYTLIG